MDKLFITGGVQMRGTIRASGSKNGTLAILAATLLAKGQTILKNVPRIGDIYTMVDMLRALGADCYINGENVITIDATELRSSEAPYDLVKKMRASFTVLGPLLARMGYAKVAMPGGCDIGARPIDFHVKGIQALGAHVETGHGYVEAEADKLTGSEIYLDFPSAGATQHIMTAACLAEGVTVIQNAAMEPEIVDLADYLTAMGAKIEGAGTTTVRVEGVKELIAVEHSVIPDRMEAGTYAVAAAMTQGDVRIESAAPKHMEPFLLKLRETGAVVTTGEDWVRVRANSRPLATDVVTMPHPGFPTDMQQPFVALLSLAQGTSIVTENVYERRFRYVSELQRMGADIKQDGRTAVVKGVEKLSGAPVTATDLRAGAALVVAALAAEGDSEISGIEHIDRGYEGLVDKLITLGAQVIRADSERKGSALCSV
ncbi:MAG TPA: UDP-N-acetylglucosamine 1-carboxyvinyltransferase [Armatimonadota bacterium]|nr:UDP-N-acetylglucosamine 1-carboxyvinyltransferase [Armatimonadota bacterium]